MRPVLRPSRLGLALGIMLPLAVAACTASPGSSGRAAGPATTVTGTAAATPSGGGRGSASATSGASTASSPSSSPSPSPTLARMPRPEPRVVRSTVHTPGGATVTVAVFRGPVTFVLHNGSEDPGPAASARGVRAGPAIGSAERRHLLAAFNGGFKLDAGAGGYEQEKKVISPLVKGDASFIIDADGRARIARWGYGAPRRGEHVYSVRQNLGLLVSGGKPVPAAVSWWEWGAPLAGSAVARSAVGMDAQGDIIYAASMSALPEDLALALADKGARVGMELDINPEWVQFDVARHPGGTLRTALPGQVRPADQYLTGWIRDFITVLG